MHSIYTQGMLTLYLEQWSGRQVQREEEEWRGSHLLCRVEWGECEWGLKGACEDVRVWRDEGVER